MTYFTPEDIQQAKQLDLLTYLQIYEPDQLVKVSGDTYCTKEHDSLKISNGKWHWFSRKIGGKTALDYLVKVKLDAETRFLAKHEYGTAAELETHKEKSTGRISELEQERNALRSQLRAATRKEDAPAVESLKSRIKEVSSEIKTLRQEVKLCDGIEARSALMERNLEQLQQEQEIERKEEEQHELFRRGGRSGRPFESERR